MMKLKRYFSFSVFLHGLLAAVLIFGMEFSTPLPVLENTNKQDIISAVVLGDTAESKIIRPTVQPIEKPKPEEPKPEITQPVVKKEVIALTKKKKITPIKPFTAQDLLSDIKQIREKHQKLNQKQMKQKLQEQAEKTLREQLLKENIRLEGKLSRQTQGEVNKYKALILQAISEKWIVPTAANKKLSSELMIRLTPAGVVVDVQITKSSGDQALDASARAAVLKASPLPVPDNPRAFDAFKQFVLKVKPENILVDRGLV